MTIAGALIVNPVRTYVHHTNDVFSLKSNCFDQRFMSGYSKESSQLDHPTDGIRKYLHFYDQKVCLSQVVILLQTVPSIAPWKSIVVGVYRNNSFTATVSGLSDTIF